MMISPWNEFRVMRYMLLNADTEILTDPFYPIHVDKNFEPDVILGPAGVDPGLASLNIPGVSEVVQKLIADGYLKDPKCYDDIPLYYEIHFTDKGRYYMENLWRSSISKTFWSIIMPILVALITTLIALSSGK